MKIFSVILTKEEKLTFRYHTLYSILEGFIFGVLALNEFIFLKSMKGSNFNLGVLFQVGTAVFVLLIFFNVFIKRIHNKNALLRQTAIVTRLPLLLLLFFPKNPQTFLSEPLFHYLFLILFLIFYLESPITLPLVNLFLKHNYRHENFGVLYGFSTTINKIVTLFVTLFYGILLDIDHYAFTYILPMTGVIGVLSIFMFSKITFIDENPIDERKNFISSVKDSIKNMKIILKENHPFRHFEIGFMLYGIAFMMTVTVITIFFERVLHLNYVSVAFYKNAFNIIAIAMIPFFGKLIGTIDPRKFTVFSLGSMMLAILFIALTEFYRQYFIIFDIKIFHMLLLYVFWYGLFLGSMSIVWRIGSAYFCEKKDTAIYQSIHLSATGIRALFAPLFGVVIYEIVGFSITFGIAIGFLIAAIGILYWSTKHSPIQSISE